MLAPHELKNKTFTKSVRGYNSIEVDEYIEFLIEKYTEIYRENNELEKKLKSVAAKLDQILDEEESIRTTLLNAQKMAERIVSDATARADIITDSIKERSDDIIARLREQINAEKDEMWEIRTRILDFKKTVFDLYRNHIESLQELSVNEIEDIVLPDEDKLIAGIFSDIKTTIKTEIDINKPEVKTIPDLEMDKLREEPAAEPVTTPQDNTVADDGDDGDDYIKKLEETESELKN